MTVITILFVIEHVTTLSCIFFFLEFILILTGILYFFCTINYYFNALGLLLDIRFLVLIDF